MAVVIILIDLIFIKRENKIEIFTVFNKLKNNQVLQKILIIFILIISIIIGKYVWEYRVKRAGYSEAWDTSGVSLASIGNLITRKRARISV